MGWCVVIFVLLGAVPASSFTEPLNVVNQKGATDTEITCGITNQASATGKSWHKTSATGTAIAGNSGIVTAMQNDYEMVVDTNKWNLKITKALVTSDADKYVCQQDANTGTARLVLVDTPTCTLSDKNTDKVTFTCNTTYGGDWPPTAAMKDNNDAAIETGVAGSDGNLIRQQDIPIAAGNEGHNFKCEIGFVLTDNPDEGTDKVAQNIPVTSDAKYKCSSTAAKAAGVTITPSGQEFDEGDALTCTATGNPLPKIQWSDGTDDLSSTDGVLTMRTDMAEKTLTCTASNNLGTAADSRAITSVQTTTAAPTTVPTRVPLENAGICARCYWLVIAVTYVSAFFF